MAKLIPMPGRTFMAMAIVLLFALDGLWSGIRTVRHNDWYVEAAYIAGYVFGNIASGALIGGALWLGARCTAHFQLKTPRPWMSRLSAAVYLLGVVLGGYVLILAVLSLPAALADQQPDGQRVVFFLTGAGLFYWFIGRAISYVLGR